MPRFYFDIHDGERQFHDQVGIDLARADDVPDEATGLLRDLARVHLKVGRWVMTAKVRNVTGALVYRAEMTIVGERYD